MNTRTTEPVHRLTLGIRTAIHADLVVKARSERRSVNNLINLILEQWFQAIAEEKKEGK